MAGVKPLAAPIPLRGQRGGGLHRGKRKKPAQIAPGVAVGVYTVKRCPPHTCEKRQNKKMSPSANAPRLRLVEQAMGIEPTTSAWEADVLPLNYACIFDFGYLFSIVLFTI